LQSEKLKVKQISLRILFRILPFNCSPITCSPVLISPSPVSCSTARLFSVATNRSRAAQAHGTERIPRSPHSQDLQPIQPRSGDA